MMINKLQDILDLLRTGSAPDAFGMTEQQWLQHKVNKACAELQAILDELHNEGNPDDLEMDDTIPSFEEFIFRAHKRIDENGA